MTQVLILEPYYGGSHARFVDGFRHHTRHDTTAYTLPARFWKWRMHGAAVTFAHRLVAQVDGPADVILASDMLDLSTFLALARPYIRHTSCVLYMHENQLTYPTPPGTKRDLHYGWINYVSMLAADKILFNSQFHLDEFFDELPRLLKHFPDFTSLSTIATVQEKSNVLHLGASLSQHDDERQSRAGEVPTILWNQRWEYDKAPERFFNALYVLADAGLPFRVILAGENFRNVPAEFEEARTRLGERIIHYGWAPDRAAYSRLLWQADVVVSTAVHEFFGLAAVEAMYCNCYPILPNRLAYPELIPAELHDRHLYDNEDGLLERLRWSVEHPDELQQHSVRQHIARFDWRQMIGRYDAILDNMVCETARE
jgi:glycosyltransferase involved in cell wall biosynthesis